MVCAALSNRQGEKSGSSGGRNFGLVQRLGLARGQRVDIEIVDHAVEQAVPVHLGAQPHEDGAQADRGPVHQHELARRFHAADPF